ncbi:inter-alpha-trypsin inhibitor heavy chain H2 [Corythoichthys intestinalis]|uniref:inter-alpha-trypsin inhibitor heavy chain H2 n=1 Tax=Corythoichthys intestinalis TaxID=161448 RepID=UPI0025A51889|nr:inter-alpha-trypsin inhibitor heavy chain H2 [Corythoichthys intestinalis]XP_061809188.1 inter-alpha-trypsin inhibitor heavy chain H2-like [Nerophis lumbriciformis]
MKPEFLLLLLGLLSLRQSRCFEFVIDGEWEDEEPALRNVGNRHKRAVLTSEEQEDFEAIRGDDITVKSYKMESRITSRFAHTTVRSSVVNSGSKAQTIGFNVQIPKRAFITNFTMNVNGITFTGSVKEKTVARNLYAQARAKGKAAGIVRANSQEMETFKTEVHVPPGSNIEFELHYQEMMQRRLGVYQHSLHLQPGRLVPQFQVDIYIFEPNGIGMLEASNNLGQKFDNLVTVTQTPEKAHVVFKPNLQQQRKCDNCTQSAIDGELTVKYDVRRDSNAGELQVSDGHFVHFFAPSNMSPLPKNIVFVIDVSGSMWGVKMKQTVEAMQAILDDLTVDDQFSIIDFNHNVRCWSEDLVPGSSVQIADAKKYIQNIKPSGGTNINEALMKAVQILVRASNQGLIDPRSVSMIILVSDGDPTVGEIKLSTIQKNVKKAMRDDFSLFSLGIGFDVDYDFLERIAMDNRGIAQRIFANHDAAEQLRTFYSQVSNPLLRRITVQFPEDSVSDVTQNQFDKYFGGSELVVAGKVRPSDSDTLTSFTTASGALLDITLETEVDTSKLDMELAKQQHSFTGFARQLWAYITIKQMMSERALAPTAAKKRKITQRILALAMEHQFVTPLTALLVESEDSKERLLADSPKDPKQGCCSGSGLGGASRLLPPVKVVYQPPPWVQMTTPVPPSHAVKGPEEWALPNKVNLVDNDPHFIVHLPRSDTDVCFNIDSQPGRILNLLSDRGTGVAVNGQLIGGKKPQKGREKTYFGVISVIYRPDGISVAVGTDKIAFADGKNNHTFTWGATADIVQNRVRISIVKDSQVLITVNGNIQVMVLLHRVWKKHPVNVDFLGLYLPNDNQYSPLVHGLIGQFSQEPEVYISNIHDGADPLKKEATMEVKGNKLQVTRGWQKDYRRDKRRGSDVYCWFVHNSGKGFIDGHFSAYIVPDLHAFLSME